MLVVFPLMPQGVEHIARLLKVKDGDAVVFPLMPQGVEHSGKNSQTLVALTGGFSVDAARR